MAGCSTSAPAPSVYILEILRELQSVGLCSDLHPSNEEPPGGVTIKCLFDRILSVFSKEISKRAEIQPLPAMLGDGRSVDLLMLFSIVQAKGGFDTVTEKCAWKSVAEAMGLESGIGSSLKLVFFKYLDALEQWLQRVSGKKAMRERTGYKNPSSALVTCSSRGTTNHKKDCKLSPPSSTNKEQFLGPLVDVGRDDDDVIILEKGSANEGINHRKRKREGWVGMLNWVRNVAKDPGDPSVSNALSSDKGKGKVHAVGECYAQALLIRQARFFGRTRRTSPNLSHLQEGQKIYASVYENGIGSTSQAETMKSIEGLQSAGWLSRDQQWACIPVGAKFQAEVPIWTGKPTVISTDIDTLKWLGTRTWPPENEKSSTLLDYASIGRGRQCTCQCVRQGSMECIRFHIAEKRFQLKRELGPVFHDWKYEYMGEEVALSWTKEEVKRFRDIVFQNRPSLNKHFWHQLYLYFPFKGRKSLWSYYFNVFLLERRRYQNHVMPKIIDSDDDDETKFDSLSNSFGDELVKVRDSNSIVCAQNQQYVHVDA